MRLARDMTKRILLFGIGILTISPALRGQSLDTAEVRLPYGELKQLLARALPAPKPDVPKPALLAARLRFSLHGGRPVIDATFRTACFGGDRVELIPLLGGEVTLEKLDPADASLVADGASLCLVARNAGTSTLQLRLLPILHKNRFSLVLPACPSLLFETGELAADQSVVIGTGDSEETLGGGQIRPLPNTGQSLTIRLLDRHETREALRPPEPSAWTWQNQVLALPAEGALVYQVIANASAAGGSGVEAMLPLPPDAQDVTVTGDDLVAQTKIRGENRALGIKLVWKTRGVLDRQVTLAYRLALRPLDRVWHLQAPGGEGTRSRFIIATSPVMAYAADGLTPALSGQGLPTGFAQALHGTICQHLEAATTADLSVTPIPVAATAEGVVTTAEWSLKIEPDGAMLATGVLSIEHKGPLGFMLDTPPGMKLLSCELANKPVSPVDLGMGALLVTLPAQAEITCLSCSFTGRTEPLDPVEGTVSVALPKSPLFMHALVWQIELPAGYQAETHGNLTRQQVAPNSAPARITLRKNLCRDERPEIQLFYQRSDLKL